MSVIARHRPGTAAVAILALIAQLLLPILHAQGFARQNGAPLLYAYCGEHPALIGRQLREQIASAGGERRLSDAHRGAAGTLSCSLCASVHGGILAGPPVVTMIVAGLQALVEPTLRAAIQATIRLVVLPPLRAPPAFR